MHCELERQLSFPHLVNTEGFMCYTAELEASAANQMGERRLMGGSVQNSAQTAESRRNKRNGGGGALEKTRLRTTTGHGANILCPHRAAVLNMCRLGAPRRWRPCCCVAAYLWLLTCRPPQGSCRPSAAAAAAGGRSGCYTQASQCESDGRERRHLEAAMDGSKTHREVNVLVQAAAGNVVAHQLRMKRCKRASAVCRAQAEARPAANVSCGTPS